MKSTIADFPDWFGPMLVKELRQGLKTKGFVFSFIGLQVVLVLVLIYHVLLYSQSPQGFDATGLGVIFWMLIGALLLVVTPLRAFNELASERKANTLELIFMSGLSAWRITFGKWVSLLFQALLFLLAVLPYAILRYYFGAVDLTEDLTAMLVVLLSCAVLSAGALAISGMPFWVRLVVAVIGGFYLLAAVPALFMGRMFGSRFHLGFSWDDAGWLLIGWDVVVVCLIALQIGAQTVAPAAENHAGLQRFFALLLWLPVPVMHVRKASEDATLSQLMLFACAAGGLAWHHLSTKPAPLGSYCAPFRGWRAFLGVPFQPGWPGAVVFLGLSVALFEVTLLLVSSLGDREWLVAASIMSAAALLCATLVWVTLRRQARHPLLEQTIFLILCGVAVALILAGKPSQSHLADHLGFGLLPPVALWAMMDHGYVAPTPPKVLLERELFQPGGFPELTGAQRWELVAFLAFVGYAVVLLALSSQYWLSYIRLCRGAARPAPLPPKP